MFNGSTSLERLTFLNSGTIGASAADGCTALTHLYIGEGIRTISQYAFRGCSAVVELTLPITYSAGYGSSIAKNPLYDLTNVVSIHFLKGSTGVGPNYSSNSGANYNSYAHTPWYMSRNSITEITLDEGIVSIGNYMFSHMPVNSLSIEFPVSLTSIGASAFDGGAGLTGSLELPNIVSIGNRAFYGCTGLGEILDLGESLTTIGSEVFYNCSGFVCPLILPNTVTSIGSDAFYNCTGFTSLTLSDNLESIPQRAFYKCSGFTGELHIPASVTTIADASSGNGYGSFGDCAGFTSLVLEEGLEYIGNGAFSNCNGFRGTLKIPDTVTYIGARAFTSSTANYESFDTLILGRNVETAGGATNVWSSSAFYNICSFETVVTYSNPTITNPTFGGGKIKSILNFSGESNDTVSLRPGNSGIPANATIRDSIQAPSMLQQVEDVQHETNTHTKDGTAYDLIALIPVFIAVAIMAGVAYLGIRRTDND